MFDRVQQKDNLYIDITNSYALIDSQDEKMIENILESISNHKDSLSNVTGKLLNTDLPSRHNWVIKTRGIIVTDSYNNPIFPIKFPRLDTSKVDLLQLVINFKELYGNIKLNFLPWHFIIEFIKNGYFIFNTRPIDQKFPLNNKDCQDVVSKHSIYLNEKSKEFFKIQPFDFQDSVHILIIGDSNIDVYTKQIYEMLAYNCINPILRQWGYSKDLWNKVWFLNIGEKFNMPAMERCIKT